MAKRVLDVGNCGPDHHAIRTLIEQNFAAEVVQVHSSEEAINELSNGTFDLVLVNRVFDRDGFEGIELIREMRESDSIDCPVMLITNYPKYQVQAAKLGAAAGFGKAEIGQPNTIETLGQFLC